MSVLHSSQPQSPEAILTALLNEIAAIPDNFILVLDDYHVLDAKSIDQALAHLVEHLPPQMHLVITTREDPALPLARLRARGFLTEVRAADLRFTSSEAAAFLTQVMGLHLSIEDVAALERRTEGWIAGLQLAALSLQGKPDAASFIRSFAGSHHFVLDYLLEEVLLQQSEGIQHFLLRTSILDRLCGPLCDAILLDPASSGQATLEYLEHANLFLVPLDNERRWYRYHQLFADLLRQRLHQQPASSIGDAESQVNELHIRASQWYEEQGLWLEAFQHAAAAHAVERAARLVEGDGMPLHFRGAVTPVLHWLESLPKVALDARPALWVMYASALTMTGILSGVEEKLQAAEAALQGKERDDTTQDVVGQIAAIRAMLAVPANQLDTIMAQSRRALEYLHPGNLAARTSTLWTLGFASFLQGDRAAARRAYSEAIALSQAAGNLILFIGATIGLGNVQEADTRLALAAETYRRVLELAGDLPQPPAIEAHLGLARLCYAWNDLQAAAQHGQQCVHLARQLDNTDKWVAGAGALLAEAGQSARQHNLVYRLPEVAAVQVLTLLRQGSLAAAAHLAQTYDLPLSQARVHLAQGDPSAALAVLSAWREQVEAKGWEDERLKVLVPWEAKGRPVTPRQIRRVMPTILSQVGTPVRPCQPRGKAPGRAKGFHPKPAPRHPVIYKTSKKEKKGKTALPT